MDDCITVRFINKMVLFRLFTFRINIITLYIIIGFCLIVLFFRKVIDVEFNYIKGSVLELDRVLGNI